MNPVFRGADLDAAGEAIRKRRDYDARIGQARRRAQWELGDASWADAILAAFMFPGADARDLDEDQRA